DLGSRKAGSEWLLVVPEVRLPIPERLLDRLPERVVHPNLPLRSLRATLSRTKHAERPAHRIWRRSVGQTEISSRRRSARTRRNPTKRYRVIVRLLSGLHQRGLLDPTAQ